MPESRDTAGLDPERLRGVALFAALSAATLQQIAAVAIVRSYPHDTHILLQGDDSRAAYFILAGTVRIYRVSEEGREQVLVRLGPGQAFNTVPMFQWAGANPANALALTDATLCFLLKEDFLRLVQAHSDLAMSALYDFAGRLVHLTDLVEGLALHSVQERLARFLLDQAPTPSGDEAVPALSREQPMAHHWTQQDIAVHLGTVRDVVGRELRALEALGIVRLERGRIVLQSREALEQLAAR